MSATGRAAVLFDIDGTLVDSTYHHALAWHRAFAGHDLPFPLWRTHRTVGTGGDKLVAEVAGSKPDPDLIEVTLGALGALGARRSVPGARYQARGTRHAVMVGDPPYETTAAERAGLSCICPRSGGYSGAELPDVALVQIGNGSQERFLDEAAEALLDKLRKASA